MTSSTVAKPRRRSRSAKPMTVDHFRRWALELTLDNGEPWEVESFFLDFAEDVFAGYREAWLVVPEENTKTTSLAGLALYHLEHVDSAFVPWAASSRDQAELGYRQAEGFVLRSPRLVVLFKTLEGYRRIVNRANRSRLQVFAADERGADGAIFTWAIIDELHRHKSLGLYRTWRGKTNKRDGQLLTISTAGEPGSEFEDAREAMRALPEVTRTDTFTRAAGRNAVIHDYAVPAKGDVDDLELVAAANPFSGVTVETLQEKRESPTWTLEHWRRFTCNIATRSSASAIEEAEWDQQRTDDAIPAGEAVWAGLDIAWKWDTTALVPLWPRAEDFRLLGPATVLEPPRNGQSLDPGAVEAALIEVHTVNPIHTLVMDIHRGEQLAAWAQDELGCEVVDRGQSDSFACMDYERWMEALRMRWLWHSGDDALRTHVLNAVAKILPRGDIRFDRPTPSRGVGQARTLNANVARRRVVDALTAAAMVHSTYAATLVEEEEDSSWKPL